MTFFLQINGLTVRVDRKLSGDLLELEREMARREARPARREGILLFDFRNHADLHEAKLRACAAAVERERSRPPLEVKPGDWVRIDGFRFYVGDVHEEDRMVLTERIGPDRGTISSVPCHGIGLKPETAEEARLPDRNAELDPPATMRDGYSRARFALEAHERALGDRWTDD